MEFLEITRYGRGTVERAFQPSGSSSPGPPSERDLLSFVQSKLVSVLPDAWFVARGPVPSIGNAGPDEVFEIHSPDGGIVFVLAVVKLAAAPRDLKAILDQLRWVAGEYDMPSGATVPLVAARYLPKPLRDRIGELGGGYADATGNVLIRAERPALFLRDRGADADPWRGRGRPRSTLNGTPAARVVRALADFRPPYSVPSLAAIAGSSTGATYRAVDYIEEQGLLEREAGLITDVRWRSLIEAWAQSYGFERSNRVSTWLEPRGLGEVTARLKEMRQGSYVVTGSLAVQQFAPYAPPRLASLYVRDIEDASERLGLRRVETGGNVVLAETEYDVVFDRPVVVETVAYAAPSQIAVDLLTGPGRAPSEGVELLSWMERNEPQWRKKP